MQELWWVWIVAGVALAAIEIFVPGFVILWVGIAVASTAVPVYLDWDPIWILAYFGAFLLTLTVFVRRLTMEYLHINGSRGLSNTEALVGVKGVVVESVDSVAGTGQARVGGEVWTAASADGSYIPAESIVTVVSIDGVTILVKREG